MNKRDVIIIGGGAGGLTAASVLSQLGLKVTLIEKNNKLGGDCLHYGCVPSKTLLHQAKISHLLKTQKKLNHDEINHRFSAAMTAVQNVINSIQTHDDPKRFENYGCEVIFGKAAFVGKNEITVDNQIYTANRLIIATGSSPISPPIMGLDQCDYLTNETIFSLKQKPSRLIIIGAGVIGIELAQALTRLNVDVSVLDITSQIMTNLDEDASALIKEQLEREGVKFYLGANINRVTFNQGIYQVEITASSTPIHIESDALLVATGRESNCRDLALKKAGVDVSPHGIIVDNRLRTSNKHIYAIGDVVACPYKLTHLAEYHASLVIPQIAFKIPQKVNHNALPSVVYTQPECAMVGSVNENNDGVSVIKFSMSDIDRAITDEVQSGFCKVFVKKGKLLGAVIVGENAGELIAEFTLAINVGLKLDKIAKTIHAYPTLSQINKRAAGSYYAPKLFSEQTKNIVTWLNRLLP